MTSKQKKSIKGGSLPIRKPKVKGSNPALTWIMPALYGVFGGLTFYFLHPILTFTNDLSSGVTFLLTLLCAGLAFFGSTEYFKSHAGRIALWTLPLICIQVAANILLTYQWIDTSLFVSLFANTLTIPLAIIWFFVLKYKSITPETSLARDNFTLARVYTNSFTKVAAILVLVLAGALLFYRLGYFDIWEDENLVINAAIGFQEYGFSYFDEGYDRAWLHTVLISGVFDVLGVSEFNGRLLSAVFGIIFVIACFYVFARWYGIAWLALIVPLVCLMNDHFLMLFRYMRMYALLIPLFLISTYLLFKAIRLLQQSEEKSNDLPSSSRKWIYVGVALLFLPLLAHIHKLSMILLPVIGFLILYLVLQERSKNQMKLLYVALSAGVILLFFAFVVQLDSLKMFRQVARRMFEPHNPMPAYFEYVFANGLPLNSTMMILIAGLGLLGSSVSRHFKSLLVMNYLLIIMPLIFMVYLIQNEGRDYRYIAHIVPFVISTLLLIIYFFGKVVSKRSYPLLLLCVLPISGLTLLHEYPRVYERHPWAPWYSTVYQSLQNQYKPGDGLFAQNIKTYYLDPIALAGPNYHKVPKKAEYTKEQFMVDIKNEGQGWFMWELHKSHKWRREIIEYIYKNFKPIHNSRLDDLGVELFYFDETMIR